MMEKDRLKNRPHHMWLKEQRDHYGWIRNVPNAPKLFAKIEDGILKIDTEDLADVPMGWDNHFTWMRVYGCGMDDYYGWVDKNALTYQVKEVKYTYPGQYPTKPLEIMIDQNQYSCKIGVHAFYDPLGASSPDAYSNIVVVKGMGRDPSKPLPTSNNVYFKDIHVTDPHDSSVKIPLSYKPGVRNYEIDVSEINGNKLRFRALPEMEELFGKKVSLFSIETYWFDKDGNKSRVYSNRWNFWSRKDHYIQNTLPITTDKLVHEVKWSVEQGSPRMGTFTWDFVGN